MDMPPVQDTLCDSTVISKEPCSRFNSQASRLEKALQSPGSQKRRRFVRSLVPGAVLSISLLGAAQKGWAQETATPTNTPANTPAATPTATPTPTPVKI